MKTLNKIKKPKKNINDEINECLNYFGESGLILFMQEILPLVELYNANEENDWVRDEIGEDHFQEVRLIRTVYLISKLAELQAYRLAYVKCTFPNLYSRMEKEIGMKN